MKAYIPFLMIPMLCMGFISCQDEESSYSLQVIKTEAYFQAKESKGYIILSQSGNFTASSSEDWCQVSCKEDSVLLKVSNNMSLEGRTAEVTITSADGSQKVPVSQAGGFFRSDAGQDTFIVNNKQQKMVYDIKTVFDYEVSTDASWITPSISSEGTTLNIAPNTSGTPRYAKIQFYCGTLNQTITTGIYQYESSNFLGDWTAQWQDKSGKRQQKTIQIVADENHPGQMVIEGLQDGIRIPVIGYGNSVAVVTNSYAGMFNSQYQVYICGLSEENIIYSKEKETVARHYFCNPEYLNDKLSYPFKSDSTFQDGKKMGGFALSAYKNNQNMGAINQFLNLELTR